ncbi:MAG: phosphoribosylformylglycinamidine cyclo-ligase [candidate division Zixibacteria bacterium]|nr:phosphoribosylformylglycinamidine cyclo-ligase [candidate division Zixibacteria bacterium]
MDYRKAGVDISAGNEAAKRIGKLARSTFNERVVREVGGFGGFFSIEKLGVENPVLVSSSDGIGTKLLVARLAGKYDSIGEDLVNHCINDIACCGAVPLFFMDYFAISGLKPTTAEDIISGMVKSLAKYNCPLIGGETAEMPDLYSPGDFDLAGFIVGVVNRESIIDGSAIKPGGKIIALPSNGLHTNGYTLARKVLFGMAGFEVFSRVDSIDNTVGEELLLPHICYLDAISKVKDFARGIAHITGGGLKDNIIRILPEKCRAEMDLEGIKVPPIFDIIQRSGSIENDEMYRAFNMGVGLVIIVDDPDVDRAMGRVKEAGFNPVISGEIASGNRDVILKGTRYCQSDG